VISATLFALLSLLILVTFAVAVGGVRVQPLGLASMVLRLLIGSLPMMGLGFAIGYGTSANSAPAVANLIYLPLSFASGLFMPLAILPDFIQKVATYLPTYHYAQLAWSAVGARSEPLPVSILWLVGYSVLLFALAARLYRREEAIKFA
jgi:ABC-2 type transport system permease protein